MKIDNNPEKILSIILNIWKIYTEYLILANKANKQNNKIWIQVLWLEQDLHISNKEKKEIITLLQE